MAEALLRKLAGDRFEVYSAGTDPKGVNPFAKQVLEEIGVDTVGLRSKHISEYLGKLKMQSVIVVCDSANESCPRIFPGMRERLFWPFEDPPAFQGTDDERLKKFRDVRDAIHARIREWLGEN